MTDELEKLQAEFAAADEEMAGIEPAATQANATPGEPAAETEPLNSSEQIQGVLVMAVNVLAPMFPSLRQVYTDEVVKSVGDATAPLANKHNFNILGWFARYQEEIVFAGVMIPVAMSTYGAVLHDLNVKEEKNTGDMGGGTETKPEKKKGNIHKLEIREGDE